MVHKDFHYPKLLVPGSSPNLHHHQQQRHCNIPDEHRIYHYHIRKTGGTSLNHMFVALAAEDCQANFEKLQRSLGHRIVINNKI